MNLASFFYPSVKDSVMPLKVPSEDHTANATSNGFRKIKKEQEPVCLKDDSSIRNPFAQNIPQNMLKLIQIMGQTQKTLTQSLLEPQQAQPLVRLQALFESLKAKNPSQTQQNEPAKPAQKPVQQVQQLPKASEPSTQSQKTLGNKSLYVEFLANLYKQSQTGTNKPEFPQLKKETSSQNNNQPEDAMDSDELSNSNELKGKSKKIKKVNLLCGHYNREHYAKNLCNNCYHKYGRTKKPWNCSHEKLYAHGLCQNCYINKYNQQKKNRTKPSLDDKSSEGALMLKVLEDEREEQKSCMELENHIKNEMQDQIN